MRSASGWFNALLIGLLCGGSTAGAQPLTAPSTMPDFTHSEAIDWINSEPLVQRDLAGKVVLIDFWTFGCWNCYQSFPWLKLIEKQFASKGLVVVGVHTPEFPHERDRARVAEKVREFGLEHPVMIDNDLSYWRAMNNRYWPTFYIVDKRGRVRGVYVGEIHTGDSQALSVEKQIRQLLVELG